MFGWGVFLFVGLVCFWGQRNEMVVKSGVFCFPLLHNFS